MEPMPPGRLLLVCVEGSIGEALALVLAEELAVAHAHVVHLVARAAPVHALPLFRGLLAFPGRAGRDDTSMAAPPPTSAADGVGGASKASWTLTPPCPAEPGGSLKGHLASFKQP